MADRSAEPSGWHLKKEVQLGHLVTTLCVAVSAITYLGTMERRVALLEQTTATQKETNARLESGMKEALASVDRKLERINDKLDTLKAQR